jgi:hypothetical protein
MAEKEHWKTKPDEHDYPAAANYLGLLAPEAVIDHIVNGLKESSISHFKAKDLLRSSELALLPADNPSVARDLKKVKRGELLSPVLLVRGDLAHGIPLTVADGYHRICASYHLSEDADIPCRIADREG